MSGLINFCYIYIMGTAEMLIMLSFFFQFLGKRMSLIHFVIFEVLLLSVVPESSLAQFCLFVLILSMEGFCECRSKSVFVVLYAIIAAEIMLLCYGISNSLTCILSPLLFPLNPENAGSIFLMFMVIGRLLTLLLSVFCYRLVYKYFVYDTTVKDHYALMILIPTIMIFLVSEYIGSVIYGDTIAINDKGRVLNTNNYQALAIQLFGIASLFCVMYAYKKMLNSFRLSMEISLLEQEACSLQEYVREAKERYEKTKSFRHDIKNHMEIVKELIRNNQPREALS